MILPVSIWSSSEPALDEVLQRKEDDEMGGIKCEEIVQYWLGNLGW